MVKINNNISFVLDMARALAAFFVVIGHIHLIFGLYSSDSNASVFQYLFDFWGSFAHQAVVIFFVISGFLVSKSARKSIKENNITLYIISRLVRLYVVLIPALFLTYIFDSGSLLLLNEYINKAEIILIQDRTSVIVFFGNLFFLQDILVDRFGSNGPLWSLAYEFWYYVLFPLIILLLFKKNKRIGISLIIIGILFLLPLTIIKLFSLWLVGASLWTINTQIIKKPIYAIMLFIVVLVISTLGIYKSILDIGIAISFALLINTYMHHTPILINNKLNYLSKVFADFSYSLYLLHYPFLIFVTPLLMKIFNIDLINIDTLNGVIMFLIALCFSYAYAYLIYLLTEKHTNQIKKKILKGK